MDIRLGPVSLKELSNYNQMRAAEQPLKPGLLVNRGYKTQKLLGLGIWISGLSVYLSSMSLVWFLMPNKQTNQQQQLLSLVENYWVQWPTLYSGYILSLPLVSTSFQCASVLLLGPLFLSFFSEHVYFLFFLSIIHYMSSVKFYTITFLEFPFHIF